MKRTTPLKRTAFRLKDGPTFAREAKPTARAEVKVKTCTAPKCGKQFVPVRPMQVVCSQRCAMRKINAQKAEEKAKDKARQEALKTIGQLTDECRRIVQKIARIRDRADGCISCHVGANYGGVWHGSHFRPAGTNSAVELHLWNVHKACEQCNYFKGGNLAAYRPRLVAKIGAERVEWLESQTQTVKRSREYLERFKRVMGKRLRRKEAALKAQREEA